MEKTVERGSRWYRLRFGEPSTHTLAYRDF
jgi:hypothetical protein